MRAKIAAATAQAGLRLNLDRIFGPTPNLPTPRARQTVPNPAKARQTAPPTQKLQNEPTARANPCQSAPNSANARHQHENCKTNPNARPPRPLTPSQLRAAHLLVAGHSTTDIAATLQLNRHTLARWKRLPLFQQELRRLVTLS
jgi:hypothetical protein